MKKCILPAFILVLMLFITVLSSLSYATVQNHPHLSEHITQHEQEYSFTIHFSSSDLLFSQKEGYDVVELRNGSLLSLEGCPVLPAKEIKIALPPEVQITDVHLAQADYEQLPGTYILYPAQLPRPITMLQKGQKILSRVLHLRNPHVMTYHLDPPTLHAFSQKNYHGHSNDDPFPGIITTFIHQSDLAGQAIAVIHLYPLQYLAHNQSLLFYTNMTITLTGRDGYVCNDYLPFPLQSYYIEKYKQMLQGIVINPTDVILSTHQQGSPLQSSLEDASYDHVIITSAALESSWDPLVEWHTRRGLKDTVITTDYIYSNYQGETNQEQIRNFIIDAHTSWGAMYFLFGGEHETVPLEFRNYYEDTPSDQYYSDFDDDYIHEVFTGRITVDDATQIDTAINKIINYETNPPLSNYLNDILLIGMDLSIPPTDPLTRDEYVKEDIALSFIPDSYDVTKVYDTYLENHKTKALNALDDGQHLVNHADHANANLLGVGDQNHEWYIYKQDVNDLSNENKPSILVSLGCHTNQYDYGSPTDSISETFVNYNPNRAGLAFTGNTRSGLVYLGDDEPPYYLSTKLDYDWWKALFSHNKYIIGETLVDCKHHFGTDPENPDYGRHCVWTFNLLGEPAMPIWTQTPTILNVTHPPSLPKGMSEFFIHIESQGTPVNNSYVCLWKNDEIYLRAYTNETGDICFYPNPKTTGTLFVTATKQNYLPYQGDALVEDRTVLLLKGHCYYKNNTSADTITVSIFNLNTRQSWQANTHNNYYSLELLPGENINDSEVLRYISTDNTSWINVTDYTVTQQDIDRGYIEHDFILDEYYLDLVDFPMYHAEQDNPLYSIYQLCGAATAQMNLNYMWWNQTQNDTCPMKYENQTWLYETAQANNSNTSLPYIDAIGMYKTLSTYRPLPYEHYGYHFDVYNSTNLSYILVKICQWIDYPAGKKPGHPLHVPGAVPTFGDYTRWMSIRGIHMNQSAYPVPDNLGVYGFWVNDPYPTGIGENSYKTAEEWNETYFDPINVIDDPFQGHYVAVCEPPLNTSYTVTLLPSPPRYNSTQPPPALRSDNTPTVFKIITENRIINAAIEGLQDHLLPYDATVNKIFLQSYPGKPLFVRNTQNLKEDYYLIPFHTGPSQIIPRDSHQQSNHSTTTIVVIIQATTGQFKEASWVNHPVHYLPIGKHQALNIVFQQLQDRGYIIEELNKRAIDIELLYQHHSPYQPDWHITYPQEDLEFFVGQDGSIRE